MEFLTILTSQKFYFSVLILLISLFVYTIIKKSFQTYIAKNKSKLAKKRITYIKLLKSVLKYIIVVIAFLAILKINGVDVTSIIAGLGVASLVAGLALQDALKDIIMGFNIVVDDYFSIGDVLKVGDVTGKILEIGLKVTKLRDVNNNNILVISNRSISQALKISNQLDLSIPLPYEEKVTKMEKILEQAVLEIKKINNVLEVKYIGIDKFDDSAINYKIRIQAKPEFQPQIKRDSNRIIKLLLDQNKVDIPYMQIDIHSK